MIAAMLVACPHCSVHVKVNERRCPHCDETLRRSDGSIARTAGAIVLGIVAASCGHETDPMPAYGVGDVGAQSTSAETTSASTGQGGSSQGGSSQGGASQGGAGGMGGSGGDLAMPAYGVGAMGSQ